MTALRAASALMILLAGVAAGLVEGVTAQTTPTGRAISMMPARFVLGDDADRPGRLQVAQQPERLAVVLADLVLDEADAGVRDRELGQRAVAPGLQDRPGGGGDQVVDARLVVAVGDRLRGACAGDQFGHFVRDGRSSRVAAGGCRRVVAAWPIRRVRRSAFAVASLHGTSPVTSPAVACVSPP